MKKHCINIHTVILSFLFYFAELEVVGLRPFMGSDYFSPHCYSAALSMSGKADKVKRISERERENKSCLPPEGAEFPLYGAGPCSDTLTLT